MRFQDLSGGDKRDRTADLMTASCDRFVILGVFTSNPSVRSVESAGFCKVLSIASTRFRAHLGQNLGQGKTVAIPHTNEFLDLLVLLRGNVHRTVIMVHKASGDHGCTSSP